MTNQKNACVGGYRRFPFTEKFRKFGWDVNGTHVFGRSTGKFPGVSGILKR